MQAATTKISSTGDVFALFAMVFIASGAVYFGLASCGGYAWEKQLFRFAAPAIAIGAVTVPSNVLRSVGRKVAYLLAVVVGYFVIEAVGSTIYFGGGNWHEYSRHFVQALEFGPC